MDPWLQRWRHLGPGLEQDRKTTILQILRKHNKFPDYFGLFLGHFQVGQYCLDIFLIQSRPNLCVCFQNRAPRGIRKSIGAPLDPDIKASLQFAMCHVHCAASSVVWAAILVFSVQFALCCVKFVMLVVEGMAGYTSQLLAPTAECNLHKTPFFVIFVKTCCKNLTISLPYGNGFRFVKCY